MSENDALKQKESIEEDNKAIRSILAGDDKSFAFLQKKYNGLIAALVRKMIRDIDDADDLVQVTFIKAYKSLDKFNFQYSFSSWVYRIASNTCIDFLRKKRFDTISINQSYDGEDENTFDIADNSYVPDITLLKEERSSIIKEAIDSLPENYRVIINMRHKDEMDYNEISEKLNIPLGTVKAHLFRARKLLYQELKNKMHIFKA